jgi:hypothetical protein
MPRRTSTRPEQVRAHLKVQDDAINALHDKIDGLEAKLGRP